jgi:iron complex outermembrane receptor protein
MLGQTSGTISGKAVDATSGDPLPGANIVLVGTFLGASSGSDGTFSFEVPAGEYILRASFTGYAVKVVDVVVLPGETVNLNIILEEAIAEFGETIVTIGSRTERTAVETPAPVDVFTEEAIRESPQYELNQVLRDIAPSYNASHQTIGDGSDHVNPASLRGLGPDQVLVLINGKRRHTSALVHVNGTFGRGTVGVDMNAIPKSAVERVEVLRDGAAAQYGSDAIAGVVNIVLKENVNQVQINGGVGANNLLTNNNDISDEANQVDGETQYVNANYGFKIGNNGFFNVTADYLRRNRTNRSDLDMRDMFPGIGGEEATDAEIAARGLTRFDFSMKTGQGEATVGSAFFNSKIPIGGNAEFYSFGGLTYRNGKASGFYRRPNQEAQVDLSLYPNGFLPEIHTKINDQSVSLGLKGVHNGWIIDANTNLGGNSFQFNIENSMNASIGAASPTSFDAGRFHFRQGTGNLDLLKSINTGGALKSLNLALGAEFRVENYEIDAGQFESYSLGNGGDEPGVDFDTTSSGAPKNPGSQVFPGFQPLNEVDRFRNSIGIYASLESDITDNLLVDIAGRLEDYSDFGTTVNGKLAGRYTIAQNYAVRGAVSTGFRAPSLNQLWFNNVSIQFVLDADNNLVPARVLTAANADPVTKAFGIPQLKEETSVNISGGFTARPTRHWSITADGYFITIDDRVVLSSRFSSGDAIIGEEVTAILEPFESQGVGQAQFWANAVDTETKGVDVVIAYNDRVGNGNLTLSLAGGVTETTVDKVNVAESLARNFSFDNQEQVANTLFNREEQNRLEDALPRQNGAFTARYTIPRWSFMGRLNYFGDVEYKPTNSANDPNFTENDETFGAKVLLDLDVGFEIVRGFRLSVGASNVLNTFPDKHTKETNLAQGRFIYSRRVTQVGMNGGFYYTRFSWTL